MRRIKKILFVREPAINTLNMYGFLFSIIPESAMPWIYNNFLQLNYVLDWNMLIFKETDSIFEMCPAFEYYSVPEELIHKDDKGHCLKKIVTDMIDNDEYMFVYVDRFYLSFDKQCYQKEHLQHQMMIYGYDDKYLYIADYEIMRKFVFAKCSFEEFYEGYIHLILTDDTAYMGGVKILQVNKKNKCAINVKQIIYGLDLFLNSIDTYSMVNEQEKVCGINIFDYLYLEFIKQTKENDYIIDLRIYYLIYEHILLMKMRIEYLKKHTNINIELKYEQKLEQMLNNSLNLRNLIIKLNISHKEKILHKVLQMIKSLKNEELNVLSELRDILAFSISS